MKSDRRPHAWCNSADHFHPLSRREFLYIGLVGGVGLSLGDFLALQARANAPAATEAVARAKAVIHIFLPGGMASQESFDPKPNAPPEYRGALSAIKTSVDGLMLSEVLPQTAQIADKITFCRSMTHGEADHSRGEHNMFTGYRPSPAIQYPSIGSVVSHELGVRNDLPPYVCIPNTANEFAGSGFLSSAYGPFALGADPADGNFSVRDLNLPGGVDEARFARRRSLLESVDSHFRSLEKSDALSAMDSFYHRAYAMVSSQAAREAFNLKAEPDALRDEYGRNPAGQRMLLSRRLVEAGVRFVSMTYGGWDHHTKVRDAFRNQMPPFDKAFATLIKDLEQRGQLDSTLVMVTTEFGRTPKINNDEGRDHWPKVFSIAMAGGGIKRGFAYGTSDPIASEPHEDPLTVEDLAATVYHLLGVDPHKKLLAPGNRPIDIVRGGKVVHKMLA